MAPHLSLAVLLSCAAFVSSALSTQPLATSREASDLFLATRARWVAHDFSSLSPRGDRLTSCFGNNGAPTRYEYRRLATREIRLLKVFRQGPGFDFAFELSHVALDGKVPRYLAISYTWGQGDTVRLFAKDGLYLEVRPSVIQIFEALLEPGDQAVLWIDALCINQADHVEQEHQIPLMREIYRRAGQVVISLGNASHDSDLAMDFTAPLASAFHVLCRNGTQLPKADLERTLGIDSHNPTWTALRNLFGRPWFSRVWVVQEVVYGRDPVFLLGKRAVAWDQLASVASRLFDQVLFQLLEHDVQHPESKLRYPVGVQSIAEIQHAREIKRLRKHESLQQILLEFHHFGATNAKDKIYALMGLATDALHDAVLDPTYGKLVSVEQVYTDVAQHLLLRDQSVLILQRAGVGFGNRNASLPSWVPDWRAFADDNCFGSIHGITGYQAGLDHASGARLKVSDPTGRTLVVEGLIVDEVRQVGSVRVPLPDDTHEASLRHVIDDGAWLSETWGTMEALKRRMRAGALPRIAAGDSTIDMLEEALCRTIVANFSFLHPQTPTQYCKVWRKYVQELSYGPQYPLSEMTEQTWKGVMGFDIACTRATMGRRLFATENGLMGLTGPDTRPGDSIAIILGGKTPFLIRSDNNSSPGPWTLVGEAYIHGMMNGEALDLNNVIEIELV